MPYKYETKIEKRETHLKMRELIKDNTISSHLGIEIVDEQYHMIAYHAVTSRGGVTITSIYSPISEKERKIIIVGDEQGVEEVRLTLEQRLFPEIDARINKQSA